MHWPRRPAGAGDMEAGVAGGRRDRKDTRGQGDLVAAPCRVLSVPSPLPGDAASSSSSSWDRGFRGNALGP